MSKAFKQCLQYFVGTSI